MAPRFVILGDLHAPWHHKKAITWALEIIKAEKPDYVIQVGDAFDFFSLSRFPKASNQIRMTPGQELAEARQTLEELWAHIQRISKRSKCIQLLGNHEDRLNKRIIEAMPELVDTEIVQTRKFFQFKGVKTIDDVREEFVLHNICFMHGYRSKLGDHAKHNQMNTVCGHSHRGGTVFLKSRDSRYWELNAGFLGDPAAKALSYTRQRWNGFTLGLGMIDALGPRFIPYGGK